MIFEEIIIQRIRTLTTNFRKTVSNIDKRIIKAKEVNRDQVCSLIEQVLQPIVE